MSRRPLHVGRYARNAHQPGGWVPAGMRGGGRLCIKLALVRAFGRPFVRTRAGARSHASAGCLS